MKSETKKCFKCGQELPVEAFYRHSRMADGRLGKCKTCTKRDVRENLAARADQYRAYEKRRASLPHRVKARAEYAKSESGKVAIRRAGRNYVDRHPLRKIANTAVSNAVRDGRLIRLPCEVCGAKAEAHHDDYSKPLDVRWLCKKHHVEWHKHNEPKG